MTHEERLQIAREIADRILEKYGDQVTAIAVYGSVAKGEDATHSDIDMWVATSTSQSIEDVRFFVYKGIPISINWDTEQGRLAAAGQVTPFWPLDADELRSYLLLFERGDFVHRLKAAASGLRDQDFLDPIRTLMARTCESTNKMRNARQSGDHYRLLVEGRWLALETALIIGHLNRRYYKGGRGLYQLSKQMPKQPRDYPRLLDLAGGFATVEPDRVYEAAIELWTNLCELVRDEGITWESSQMPL